MVARPRKLNDSALGRMRESVNGLATALHHVAPDGVQIVYKPARGASPATWAVTLMKSPLTSVSGFGSTLWAATFEALVNGDRIDADARRRVRHP